MPRQKWTDEEKDQIIKAIDGYRDQGLSLPAACAKTVKSLKLVSDPKSILSLYNWWKAKRSGKAYVQPKGRQPKKTKEEKLENILGPVRLALDEHGGGGGATRKPASSQSPSDRQALAERTLTLLERMWDIVDNER